ncbi:MAG: sugar phosphate isomerase/epimerase [Verrucomicrobia bacterium]|nr:sugar phosphate isomerase/epimerase [Verrucomicrobiota bacterium]
MKVLLHVNYHEGKGRLRPLFELARQNKYDGVELRWKYAFDDFNQVTYQQEVAALKSQYPEMEIVFGGAVNFCRGPKDEVEKTTADYLRFLEWAAKECGTKVMNFFTGVMVARDNSYYDFHTNGSAMACDEDYEKAAAGLRIIGNTAAANGILIALETHNCYLHDIAASCQKLMTATNHDAIGINYDHGNICINKHGESIADVFKLVGDKIYYAHLKNLMKQPGMVLPGGFIGTRLKDGHINNRDIVDRLRGTLRSGMLALEYPCTGDSILAAKEDMEYMRSLKEYFNL